MFPKYVFKYVSNCITIVWEGLISQQAAKPRRQNGRGKERALEAQKWDDRME